MGGLKQKQYYICHIELLIPNSSIMSSYRMATKATGDFTTNDSQHKLLVLTGHNDSSITLVTILSGAVKLCIV